MDTFKLITRKPVSKKLFRYLLSDASGLSYYMFSKYFFNMYEGGDKPGDAVGLKDNHLTRFEEIEGEYKKQLLFFRIIVVSVISIMVATSIFACLLVVQSPYSVMGWILSAVIFIVVGVIVGILKNHAYNYFCPNLSRLSQDLNIACERLMLVLMHAHEYSTKLDSDYDNLRHWKEGRHIHQQYTAVTEQKTSDCIVSTIKELRLIFATDACGSSHLGYQSLLLHNDLLATLRLFFAINITDSTLKEWEEESFNKLVEERARAKEFAERKDRIMK